MTDFLGSLKADLLDRRLLPIVALLGVVLAAALAYALSGGGSSPSPGPIASPVSPLSASSIPVSQATLGAGQPVAETTSGSLHRSAGAGRNPFTPLPGAPGAGATRSEARPGTSKTAESPTPSTPSAGPSVGLKSQATSPTTGGGASPTPESKPAPNKGKGKGNSQTVYRVTVLFGAVPAGTPAPGPNLTPYDNLKRQQPLPSVAQPLVVFRGVIAGAKSATFTLVGEAILRGSAACHPSASQCQAIDLKLGEVEELEYVPPQGAPIVYQLKLSSITASKASASAARRKFGDQSKTGLQLLRTVGLSALPGMRYSNAKGVLVFAGRPAFAGRSSIGRAHAAVWGAALRG